MGNLCGKETSTGENFAGPGRPLGSAPAPQPQAPSKVALPRQVTTGPGRKLGGGGGGGGAGDEGVVAPSGSSGDQDEMRRKLREAAENRATTKSKGPLAQQLDKQRRQTRTDTLKEASEQNRQTREMDAQTEALRGD